MNIVQALKNDLAYSVTNGGDLGEISGLSNFRRALFHRLMTVPGTLIHRPTYGVGVTLYQNAPANFAVQQRLAAIIEEQFLQDPRTESVSSVSISSADGTPRMTVIKVSVKPVGYDEQIVSFTPFNEANT